MQATTNWDFMINVNASVTKEKVERSSTGYSVTVKAKSLNVEIGLPIDMWVLEDADEKIVAHEDGHVRICRYYYRDSARQARKCAIHVMNRDFVGQGSDEQSAIKQAVNKITSEIVVCYRDKISNPAKRASEIYDKLTECGAKPTAVRNAINQAIDEAD